MLNDFSTLMIKTEVRDTFVGYCKNNGLLVYAAAEKALAEWIRHDEANKVYERMNEERAARDDAVDAA